MTCRCVCIRTTTETDEKKKKKEEKRRTTHKVVRVEEESDEGDWEEVKGGASAPMVGTLIHYL